ncbi:MAG: DUF3327 domain-containing protein [Acidobacteria bacterium]|nr:DUF3327 domain-containing protein [Acidobacteriota bacterium]
MRSAATLTIAVAVLCLSATHSVSAAESSRLTSPRLIRLAAGIEHDPHALEKFWTELRRSGTPLIEPADSSSERYVTFLWKDDGQTRNVAIFSGVTMMWGFTAADLDEHQMRRLDGTDVWYRTYRFPSDTRFVYYLSPNDSLVPATEIESYQQWEQRSSTWQSDPLNPKREVRPHADRDWVVSIAELPDAPPKPWETFTSDGEGDVEEQTLESEVLDSKRRFWVYRPPAYDENAAHHPLLIVFDGTPTSFARSPGSLKQIIEYLHAKRVIESPVVVSIEQRDRTEELSCSDAWNEFLVTELVPWLRSRYSVASDPARVVVAGGSLGGLAALCAALNHPDVFGNVLSTSGFVSWKSDTDYGRIMRQYASAPKLPIRFYLDVGTFERDIDALLYANRHLRDVLVAKGYEVRYLEFSGGHDSTHTAIGLAEGLQTLLPRVISKEAMESGEN